MNCATLYAVLAGISNDIGSRITRSLARNGQLIQEFGSFGEAGKRIWMLS
jgi:hypothetical protein